MPDPGKTPNIASALVRLARPTQWAKSVFVLVGPLYGLTEPGQNRDWHTIVPAAVAAAVAFAALSSAGYVLNDLFDAPRDRTHPRKKHRPIAAGLVSPGLAGVLAAILIAVCIAAVLIGVPQAAWPLTAATLAGYALNTVLYSARLKHAVIADVVALSMGFVIRVLGGCAATGVPPSTWLLNVTFFLAMFLSFCKRLGERRTMGDSAADGRPVHLVYTDQLLRMAVVVTAVATLVTYAGYVQVRETRFDHGFNLLWLTMIPATYGFLRAIVLVERGDYDDPTEMATHDRAVQISVLTFAAMVAGLVLFVPPGHPAP